MTVTYDNILNLLNKNYTVISKDKKNYFVNDKGEIVASYNKNGISMFFTFPDHSREIWNHNGRVVVTFAKDFQVNSYVADVIIVDGLCGTNNDTEVIENYAYLLTTNDELYNINGENKKQKIFDALPYEERIKLLEESTGASLKGANIDGIRLFEAEEEPTYGSCGSIYSNNGIADITILGDIDIHNIKVNSGGDHEGFIVNIINIKGVNGDFDYDKVYQFWRKENNWNYTDGKKNVSSPTVIAWTERRKDSTVDESAINIVGNPYQYILDPIYYDSKSSINARRLQMQFVLSQIVPKSEIASIMENYNFNLRAVDVNRKPKKR